MKTISEKRRHRVIIKNVGVAGLKRRLAGFEKKYNMPTQAFLQSIERGELSESNDFIDWLGLAELYDDIQKREIK
jgi:hypothetical protein